MIGPASFRLTRIAMWLFLLSLLQSCAQHGSQPDPTPLSLPSLTIENTGSFSNRPDIRVIGDRTKCQVGMRRSDVHNPTSG